jgi:hypothetical protein
MSLKMLGRVCGACFVASFSAVAGGTYSGDDLPGLGETLTITEDSTISVAAAQTAELGGAIVVQSGGVHLDFVIDGELVVGTESSITVNQGSSIAIGGDGSMTGVFLSLVNQGGTIDWSIENDVSPQNLAITNEGSTQVRIQGRLSVANLAMTNRGSGATLVLEDDGVFETQGGFTVSNDSGQTNLDFRRAAVFPNLSLIQTGSGITQLANEASLTIQNINVQASGLGTLALYNSGLAWISNMNTETYGALLQIHNAGALEINNWYMKDQHDDTQVLTMGTVKVKNMTIVANGGAATATWTSLGLAQINNATLDANYGGHILLDAAVGGLILQNLYCYPSGWSHGVQSTVEVRAGRQLEVEHLALTDGYPGPLALSAGEVRVFEVNSAVVRLEAVADVTLGVGSPLVYPQLALGGGYEDVLIITNKSSTDWDGMAWLRQGADSDWEGAWTLDGSPGANSRFEIHLAPHASRKFVLRGDSAARPGYLYLTASGGLNTRAVTSSFFYNFLSGTQLMDSTGVPAASPSTSSVFPVEKTARVNTGLAWAAADSNAGGDIRLTLYDDGGQLIAEKTETLQGHSARFFAGSDGFFPTVPDGFVGNLAVHSDEVIYITVLRLEGTPVGFQLTSVPPDSFAP